MNEIDWKTLADWAGRLVVPLVGYVAWVVRDIQTQVWLTNGRLSKLEQRVIDHEAKDDERHTDVRQRQRDMHDSIHDLRDEVTVVKVAHAAQIIRTERG